MKTEVSGSSTVEYSRSNKDAAEIERLFLVAYIKAANAVVDGKRIADIKKIQRKYEHRFDAWFSECLLNWQQTRLTDFPMETPEIKKEDPALEGLSALFG